MATRILRLIALLIAILATPLFASTTPALAQPGDLTAMVDALGQGGFPERQKAIDALVATADDRVPAILQALADGTLYLRKSDSKVVSAVR